MNSLAVSCLLKGERNRFCSTDYFFLFVDVLVVTESLHLYCKVLQGFLR
nr:MAG TPA: hypothetical protein [Caudoviricetes sp.]